MSPGLVVKNRVKNIIPVVLWLVYILGIFNYQWYLRFDFVAVILLEVVSNLVFIVQIVLYLLTLLFPFPFYFFKIQLIIIPH
jgi:hypothetical protein